MMNLRFRILNAIIVTIFLLIIMKKLIFQCGSVHFTVFIKDGAKCL